jgi:hypothetical protein
MIPLQTASRHPVSHIVFSSDGTAVAVAQPHYGVTILDRATGGVLAVCAMPRRGELASLTFCGGKYLAASHAKGLEVFDATTGRQIAANFRRPFKSLHLAERDGNAIGLGSHTYGPVWQPEKPNDTTDSFHPLASGRNHSMTLSPSARFTLEPVSGYRVKLLDWDAARDVAEIDRPDDVDSDGPVVAKFCPLSRRFALNDGCTVDVYDTQTDESEQYTDSSPAQTTTGDSVAVAPMPHTLFSPVFRLRPEEASESGKWYPPFALLGDGRGLLVKRPRNRIQWWDAPTGTVVNEWSWRFEWVTCVAASADGLTAVAGGRFGRVLLWDLG